MAKYTVVGLVDATVCETVEADSPEEAMENAALFASVCHQCSRVIEVGDVYDMQVLDEAGELVIRFHEEARKERMTKALKDILKTAEGRSMKWLMKLAKEGLNK